MSINQRMDEENVIHLYKWVLVAKNKEIIKFVSKWTELEKIILSVKTQTQKDKNNMYWLVG